ncbi:MAG: hypothetical protein J2P17_22740 [Mycobacterium sp.]|nr:hypothetical protein [Mycobacterium sp.]
MGRTPTHVVTAHWSHPGVIIENTGSVDVFVDYSEEALEAAAGLRVRPGQTVTIPRDRDDRSLSVYAAADGDMDGELTQYVPGFGFDSCY